MINEFRASPFSTLLSCASIDIDRGKKSTRIELLTRASRYVTSRQILPKTFRLAAGFATAYALAACGGGGDSDLASSATPVIITPAPAPAGGSNTGTASTPTQVSLLWSFDKLRYSGHTIRNLLGYDTGTNYVWFIESEGLDTGPRWTALTSNDLTTFVQGDVTVDGIVAGSAVAGYSKNANVRPPEKIVRYLGVMYGVPRYTSNEASYGPSSLYTSSDALKWTAHPAITASGVRHVFADRDSSGLCPSATCALDVADVAANNTALFILASDRVLSTHDGSTWTKSALPANCVAASQIAANAAGAILKCTGGTVYRTQDQGVSWGLLVPTIFMNGLEPGSSAPFVADLSVVAGAFASTGGSPYRSYWLSSSDGGYWVAKSVPSSACSGSRSSNDAVADTGRGWAWLTPICRDSGPLSTTYDLATSTDGNRWASRQLTGDAATAQFFADRQPGAGTGAIDGHNLLVERGTANVLVRGTASTASGAGLLRVRFGN